MPFAPAFHHPALNPVSGKRYGSKRTRSKFARLHESGSVGAVVRFVVLLLQARQNIRTIVPPVESRTIVHATLLNFCQLQHRDKVSFRILQT
jgi:hypothetical protein